MQADTASRDTDGSVLLCCQPFVAKTKELMARLPEFESGTRTSDGLPGRPRMRESDPLGASAVFSEIPTWRIIPAQPVLPRRNGLPLTSCRAGKMRSR